MYHFSKVMCWSKFIIWAERLIITPKISVKIRVNNYIYYYQVLYGKSSELRVVCEIKAAYSIT